MSSVKYERIKWEDDWKYNSVSCYGSYKEARIIYDSFDKINEKATYSKAYLEKKK